MNRDLQNLGARTTGIATTAAISLNQLTSDERCVKNSNTPKRNNIYEFYVYNYAVQLYVNHYAVLLCVRNTRQIHQK